MKKIDMGDKLGIANPDLCPLQSFTWHWNRREALNPVVGDIEGERWNNLQIFRTRVNYKLGDDRMYNRHVALRDITKDIEKAFLYGNRQEDGARKTTGGVSFFSEVMEVDRLPETRAALDELIALHRGKEEFARGTLFVEQDYWDVLWDLVHHRSTMYSRDKCYGSSLFRYTNRQGDTDVILDRMVQKGDAFFITITDIEYRYLKHRDVALWIPEENIALDQDGTIVDAHEEFLAEVGLDIFHPARHMLVRKKREEIGEEEER